MRHIYRQQHSFSPTNEIHPETDDLVWNEESQMELPVDIARQADHLIIKAPLVGAKNSDVNITVNNDILYIHKTGSPPEEKLDNYYVKECHWGPIAREVQLPVSVDPSGARASLQEGILTIILPIINNRKTRIIKIR
ncbi:MAG: Hsp20/alpha crystallin family protein [Patescibacteria group bacterium]